MLGFTLPQTSVLIITISFIVLFGCNQSSNKEIAAVSTIAQTETKDLKIISIKDTSILFSEYNGMARVKEIEIFNSSLDSIFIPIGVQKLLCISGIDGLCGSDSVHRTSYVNSLCLNVDTLKAGEYERYLTILDDSCKTIEVTFSYIIGKSSRLRKYHKLRFSE